MTAVELRCPPLASDIVAESQRQPRIDGATAFEIAGRLKLQVKEKNAALRRSVAAYEECRQ